MSTFVSILTHYVFASPPTPPAGYNNLEVAEYLLAHGADVNAQDKGGLIPLHNAASYGVSAIISSPLFSNPWSTAQKVTITYNTSVPMTFTEPIRAPLLLFPHTASLCSLLIPNTLLCS